MNKYLIALPSFPFSKGFCHKTILVQANSIEEAVAIAKHLQPRSNVGDIKQVNY
jgi:hypothetical protein